MTSRYGISHPRWCAAQHREVYDQAYAAFRRHYRRNRAIYAMLNAA
jgi:hypothetical protein